MAFDFLGTFEIDQLTELEDFLSSAIQDIDFQTNHLVLESKRVRNVKYKYEQSLLNLGGSLTFNRLDRTQDITTGRFVNILNETQLFQMNYIKKKEWAPVGGYDDEVATKIMNRIKQPFIPEIKFQRERLEKMIRKTGDYVEQLEEHRSKLLMAKQETEKLLNSVKEVYAAVKASKTSVDISKQSEWK